MVDPKTPQTQYLLVSVPECYKSLSKRGLLLAATFHRSMTLMRRCNTQLVLLLTNETNKRVADLTEKAR